MRRSAALRTLIAVASVSLLAACSSSGGGSGSNTTANSAGSSAAGGTSSATLDVKELTVLAPVTPTQPMEFWTSLVKPWESQTGVHVKIIGPASDGNMNEALTTEVSAGRTPDVVIDASYSKALQPELATFDDDSWAANTPMVDNFKVDGHIYQVNIGVQPQSIVFYNKKAFADAGITTMPKDLAEFTAAMAKIKSAGYLPLQTAGDGWVSGAQFQAMANPSLFRQDPHWFADRNAKKVTFAGSAYQTFFQAWKDWIANGYIDKTAVGLKYQAGEANFLAGKSGMYVMGAWFVPDAVKAGKASQFGAFPVPTLNGGSYPPPVEATQANGYMVLKDGHVDAAKQLVKYLTTNTTAIRSALQAGGNFRPGLDYKMSPLAAAVQQIMNAAPGFVPPAEGYGDNLPPDGFDTELYKEVETVYSSGTAQSITSDLDNWWNAQS
jgi:ABC-type sugar transport system, periplasmic component